MVLNCPKAIEGMIDELQGFEFLTSEYGEISECFANIYHKAERTQKHAFLMRWGKGPEMLWSENHVHVAPCMKQPQNVEMTIMTVQAEVQKLAIQRGLAAELEGCRAALNRTSMTQASGVSPALLRLKIRLWRRHLKIRLPMIWPITVPA